jgi:hypothetical protein
MRVRNLIVSWARVIRLGVVLSLCVCFIHVKRTRCCTVPQSFGGEDGIGGAGLLKYPSDVAVSAGDGGMIAVADTGNHRYVCVRSCGYVRHV